MRGFGEDSAKGIAEKRRTPEFQSMTWRRLAANIAGLEADSIHDRNENSIRDGMGALNGSPRIVLRHAELGLLRRMPADRRGIEKHGRTLQRRQSRTLGEPLIPADKSSNPAHVRVERAKSQVARREVELLVVEWIVGDVHLAVKPAQ